MRRHRLQGIERLFIRVTLMGLVFLTATQLVLTGSTTSMLDFSVPTVGQNIEIKSVVTFSLVDASSLHKARVYVNGKKRADFSEKFVTVTVYPGDLVELDTTFYTRPVKICILKNDRQVVKNKEETILKLNQERLALTPANID